MTPQEAKACAMVLRAHYLQDIPDEWVVAMSAHIARYPADQAKTGIERLLDSETSPFPPAWALVKRYIDHAAFGDLPTPAEAWARLGMYIRRVGGYQTPPWDDTDGVLAETVRQLGGWRAVCWPTEEEPWFRKRFEAIYGELQDRYVARGELPSPNPETPLLGVGGVLKALPGDDE